MDYDFIGTQVVILLEKLNNLFGKGTKSNCPPNLKEETEKTVN